MRNARSANTFLLSLLVVLISAATHAQPRQSSEANDSTVTLANVRSFGVKGDGIANDTAAFQAAIDSGKHLFLPNGTYILSPLRLRDGSQITGEGRHTVIHPASPRQSEIFLIAGAGLEAKQRATYVRLENMTLYARSPMPLRTAAIRIAYANRVSLDRLVVNGFSDNILIDNSTYIYVTHSDSNGASHANLLAQNTDTTHGPYYSSNLYLEDSNFDSSPSAFASIFISDWSTVRIANCDVTGNRGRGIDIEQSVSPTDKPGDIVLTGNTIDSNAKEGIVFDHIRNSTIDKNWVSSGRREGLDGIAIRASEAIAVTSNQLFWNGRSGLACSACAGIALIGNIAESNRLSGIALASTSGSIVSGNIAIGNAKYAAGTIGATQLFGIVEDAASSGNTFLANKASGNKSADTRLGGANSKMLP